MRLWGDYIIKKNFKNLPGFHYFTADRIILVPPPPPPPIQMAGHWTLPLHFVIAPATGLVNKNMKYDKIEKIIRWFMFIHHTELHRWYNYDKEIHCIT